RPAGRARQQDRDDGQDEDGGDAQDADFHGLPSGADPDEILARITDTNKIRAQPLQECNMLS
ncbi:MAG: hypothetical protein Q7W29_04620, partial [bacterium]|nr:hypothetical protein [bacterium]